MRRSIVYFLFLGTILFSCKSSSKLVEQGDYEQAIEKTIKKILKGKADSEDVSMLDKAYTLANTRNSDRIKFLKAEGKPENWEQIYFQYVALDNRQRKVSKVLPVKTKGQELNYAQIDYTSSIVEAKTKAADYFYTNGKRLMKQENKKSYREAYYNFNKASKYRASAYPDLDQNLADTRYWGTSRVLVEAQNSSRARLSPDFFNDILAINTNSINSFWVEYYIGQSDRDVEYDYVLTIFVQNVLLSPERFDQKEYLREKTVPDGFSYAKDSRGNVMKDTAGNDIKVPKYKDLKCTVVERYQSKDVAIEGQIEYLKLNPDRRVIKLVPVSATSVFENVYGKAVGNVEILTKEDLELIDRRSMPFPSDIDMIYDCISPLRASITDAINRNKNLIY